MSQNVETNSLTCDTGSAPNPIPFPAPIPCVEVAPLPFAQAQPFTDLYGSQRSDDGMARRLVQRFGGSLRYCPALGWLYWDTRRWQKCEECQVVELARDTVRHLPDLAPKF